MNWDSTTGMFELDNLLPFTKASSMDLIIVGQKPEILLSVAHEHLEVIVYQYTGKYHHL